MPNPSPRIKPIFRCAALAAAALLVLCGISACRQHDPYPAVLHSVPQTVSAVAPQPTVPSFRTAVASAKEKNPDTVGWLYVPDTTLNEAIVQTKDNAYYLKHDFDKNYYWKGWPFADHRNVFDPLPRNLILYGHNMGDGTIFGQLKIYKSLDYLNRHPILYFSTAGGDYQWKIFAVYITDVQYYYIQTDFASDSEFGAFLTKARRHSLFNTAVDVNAKDNILTLSTCTYDFDNARFVIQARRVRKGEALGVKPASVNPNPLGPHSEDK